MTATAQATASTSSVAAQRYVAQMSDTDSAFYVPSFCGWDYDQPDGGGSHDPSVIVTFPCGTQVKVGNPAQAAFDRFAYIIK